MGQSEPSKDNGYVTIPVYITVCQVTQVIAALLGRESQEVCYRVVPSLSIDFVGTNAWAILIKVLH